MAEIPVLAAALEGTFALHVNVERIGRQLRIRADDLRTFPFTRSLSLPHRSTRDPLLTPSVKATDRQRRGRLCGLAVTLNRSNRSSGLRSRREPSW